MVRERAQGFARGKTTGNRDARKGDSWKLIGNAGFMDIDRHSRSAEVGLFIGDRSYWARDMAHRSSISWRGMVSRP